MGAPHGHVSPVCLSWALHFPSFETARMTTSRMATPAVDSPASPHQNHQCLRLHRSELSQSLTVKYILHSSLNLRTPLILPDDNHQKLLLPLSFLPISVKIYNNEDFLYRENVAHLKTTSGYIFVFNLHMPRLVRLVVPKPISF